MDDELMDAYLDEIRRQDADQNMDEDDEDWVLDDEFAVRNRMGEGRGEGAPGEGMHGGGMGHPGMGEGMGEGIGSIGDLYQSLHEPTLPPSPDEAANQGWIYDLVQDDPRYAETHNLRAEMMHRMAHISGDSHSLYHGQTFLDYLNHSYH